MGRRLLFAEDCMEIQTALGSDIAMVLDEVLRGRVIMTTRPKWGIDDAMGAAL